MRGMDLPDTLYHPRCPKCGNISHFEWQGDYRIDGTAVGSLWAVCRECDFRWRVKALDEQGPSA